MGVTLPHRAAALMVVMAGVPGGIPTSRCAPLQSGLLKGAPGHPCEGLAWRGCRASAWEASGLGSTEEVP